MGVFKRKNKDGLEGETWYVDYYDPNGKRVIKAVGLEKDAEAYLGKVKAAIREGRFFDVKKETQVTFNERLGMFIEQTQDQRFYETYIKYFIPVLREHFGNKLLSEITYKAMEDFRDLRKKTPTQHGTPRTERTVDIELWLLRRILSKAVKWGLLERSPFEKGEDLFYKASNRRERALTEDEVRKLIDACPGYLKLIVIAAIYTGLRRTDLLSLKWKDIDLENGLIRLEERKTGKTRSIVLNSDMKILLQGLPVREEHVFPGKNGKPFKDVSQSFETAIRKAGIQQGEGRQKVFFHTLRHTCISLLTERGADTIMVKNYVAHADTAMTERYTHLSQEYARKTSELLNG